MKNDFVVCGKCGKRIMLDTTETGKLIYAMYQCKTCNALNLVMEE